MKYLSLVWSNLKRKKLRTALTLLSIFVAFLLFGFLCTIKEAFMGGVEMTAADRLVTRNKISLIQTLPESYEARIAKLPGVTAVSHQTWFGGIYQEPKNFFASIPVQPEKFLAMYPEFVLPADQKAAWLKTRTGAIIGRSLANRFHWKVGDRIPLTSPIWGQPAKQSQWEFDVVGIFDGAKKSADTGGMYFRYDYFEEARQKNKGEVGWYVIRIQDANRAGDVCREIDDEFANSPYETKTEAEGAFAASFAKQVGDIGSILIAILSAVFFTILLVSGNTMAQAVRERTEELGVLKAMGFTNELVMGLTMLESCVMAALGGLTGLGAAWAMVAAGNPAPNLLRVFYLPPRDLVVGVGLAVVLGVVTGIFPAWQAMRLRIAEALRRGG